MADKSSQLILDALSRAVLEPAGAILHSTRQENGLFPATSAARQAADLSKEEGYFLPIQGETKNSQGQELWRISEKGVNYLLREVNPLHLLEDFVRALETRHRHMADLVQAAEQTKGSIDSLRDIVSRAMEQFVQLKSTPGNFNSAKYSSTNNEPWAGEVLASLSGWHGFGAEGDCPLPQLFRDLAARQKDLTIGQFHDCMRTLHQHEKIYLHPWTGPLYDMPEPSYALLIGHLIVYYASLR